MTSAGSASSGRGEEPVPSRRAKPASGDRYRRLRHKLIGRMLRIPVLRVAFGWTGPRDPVVVFHHLPKCGGTSLQEVLRSWYIVVDDYRSGWTESYPARIDLERLNARYCVTGHFELPGNHVHQRYPEVVSSSRYRLITFLRDPLEVKMSLYRFELEHGVGGGSSLEEHLLGRPNYLASLLPASETNYREMLDRYFFIGILEEGQAGTDLLAEMLGKPTRSLPALNRSSEESPPLSEDLVRRFRDANELDYAIYDYGLNRYRTMISGSGRTERASVS